MALSDRDAAAFRARTVVAALAFLLLLVAADPTARFLGLPRLPRIAAAKRELTRTAARVRPTLPRFQLPTATRASTDAPRIPDARDVILFAPDSPARHASSDVASLTVVRGDQEPRRGRSENRRPLRC